MFVMGHSHTLKKQPSCKQLRLRLWWRGPEGGEPEAGLPSKGPCNRIQRLENGVAATQDGDLFCLAATRGLFPDSPSRWPFFMGWGRGRRFCMVWDLKRGQNLLISSGGRSRWSLCWHSRVVFVFICLVLVSSSLSVVTIVGCTDGRTVVVPRRPFCLPLGETGVPAPGGTFCWTAFLFCSEALRITAYY
ncbi:hypothetical protein V8C43DRAFT_297944 [Trichoderma afarasin]